MRPAKIEVTLKADGKDLQTVTLSAESGWAYAVDDLPVYEDGKKIAYTWSEQAIAGYVTSQQDGEAGQTILVNTHNDEQTEATVKKTWVDDGNQDGVRPSSVVVTLLANGEQTQTSAVLSEENDWTFTVTGLPKKSQGANIEYAWLEEPVADYESKSQTEDGVTTLTNTHKSEQTSARVIKEWNDSNDRDRKRPEQLTVALMRTVGSGEDAATTKVRDVMLSEDNEWTQVVEKLPAFEAGKPITYSWVENDPPEGYTLTHTSLSADGTVTTLTNTHEAKETSATVIKEWNDAENRDAKRPASITVQLMANGIAYGEPVVLTAANNWTHTAEHLPLNEGGENIAYTWTEDETGLPEGYELSDTSVNGTITTITNTHAAEATSRSVAKVWDDHDNNDGMRPQAITVTLNKSMGGDIQPVGTVVLSDANGWHDAIDQLPKYQNGEEIAYSWTEPDIVGYELASQTVEGGTTTLTNAHEDQTTAVSVQKVWDDENNNDGKRPEGLVIELMANGSTVAEVALNAQNDWKATVDDLPKYANGRAIT